MINSDNRYQIYQIVNETNKNIVPLGSSSGLYTVFTGEEGFANSATVYTILGCGVCRMCSTIS